MKDSSIDDMIKTKVAHDWRMLEHVPEKKQITEVCLIAIMQDWEATKFVVNNNPELSAAVWDFYKDRPKSELFDIFNWVIKGFGYEELDNDKGKKVNTKKEMNKVIAGLKNIIRANMPGKIDIFDNAVKITKSTKTKLSSLLINKGKISSLLKKDRK